MVSLKDGRPIPLPDDIRAAMEAYRDTVDAPAQPQP
jgi:acyl-CoA thioesterase FadM